jgi:hypothetical protein
VKYVAAFGRFWWEFIVGDDWRVAAAVLVALGLGAILVAYTSLSDTAVSLLTGAAIMGLAGLIVLSSARAAARRSR